MGGMSIWHWIIVGGVALLMFGGKGKISDLMGDFAKGIKSFKKGLAEDPTATPPASQQTLPPAAPTAPAPQPVPTDTPRQ